MKRPLRDISIQASPSCVSHQVEYEAETLGAASSESPLSAATPGPASKLVRLAGATEREAFAVPAMPRARPRATLAQLAREVLTLQALPYEARAAAVDSWLRRARCLGDAQYHECVQLAVSLLTRRAAKSPHQTDPTGAGQSGLAPALQRPGGAAAAADCAASGLAAAPIITLDDLGTSRSFDCAAQAQCQRAMREGPLDGAVVNRGTEVSVRGDNCTSSYPAPDPLSFFFAEAGSAASSSRINAYDLSPVSSFEVAASLAPRAATLPAMPHNAGVTLDLFTGEASYEPPTRQPLCHVASDTSQFRRAVRAHDPLDGGEVPGDVMQQLSAWCSSGHLSDRDCD